MRLLLFGFFATMAAGLVQTTPVSERQVPASALQAAARGPLPLAFALSGLGVPAGIITTDNPSDPETFKIDAPSTPPVSLGSIASSFATKHPNYRVMLDETSLTIEQTNL